MIGENEMDDLNNNLIKFELESYEMFTTSKIDASSYLQSITPDCIDKYSAREAMLTVRELAKDLSSKEVECESEAKAIEAKIEKRFRAKNFYSLVRKCSNI